MSKLRIVVLTILLCVVNVVRAEAGDDRKCRGDSKLRIDDFKEKPRKTEKEEKPHTFKSLKDGRAMRVLYLYKQGSEFQEFQVFKIKLRVKDVIHIKIRFLGGEIGRVTHGYNNENYVPGTNSTDTWNFEIPPADVPSGTVERVQITAEPIPDIVGRMKVKRIIGCKENIPPAEAGLTE